MNVLVDSSVLIDLIKGKISLDSQRRYYINPIVYSEVLYGLLYVGKSEKTFISFLDENRIDLLVIDRATAGIHSRLKFELNKKGMPLPDNDLLLASTCLEHNLALYTFNVKHFKRIKGLKILDQ